MSSHIPSVQATSTGTFSLSSPSLSYIFHVDPTTQELIHDHFGGPATESTTAGEVDPRELGGGWSCFNQAREKREIPDSGRGDPRLPAIHIKHTEGHTVTHLKFEKHEVVKGKPALAGQPATFGSEEDVTTLLVHLVDSITSIRVIISYSIFPAHNAIARSMKIVSEGKGDVEILAATSFSVDLPNGELEMIQLSGDWAREAQIVKRPVYLGIQGFGSQSGYSSHLHNPFLALTTPGTTETSGQVWAFSLVYTGSFSAQVEKGATGTTRALIGLNPLHLNWELGPGETFTTPECVAVYSDSGLGGMSRSFHRLYRNHLSRSKWTKKARPALINNWEATYFDFDAEKLYGIAERASDLGVKLFVMDDGWFGNNHPRLSDNAGLGDWVVNEKRFPKGLGEFVKRVNALGKNRQGAGSESTRTGEGMKFGIWVEPEMVNPESDLYEAHPDWVLFAGKQERTQGRSQLVLNLALPEVQGYIIDALSKILSGANIEYVKWDNNRAMHEMSTPSNAHAYILGLYNVLDTLTTRFPDVLWEGCASGGGRFDPAILYYWPQSWTSDNTDGLDRLSIQFGTSLVYPPSSFGCHVSAVPNHQSDRLASLEFRAHVALMGGSFGFELDLRRLPEEEQKAIPGLVALSERVNPLVIEGDLYRLARPDESNYPAAMYVSQDGGQAVVLAYQKQNVVNWQPPPVRLQGLDPAARYSVDGRELSGNSLMSCGLQLFGGRGDLQSKAILITKV